MNTHPHNTSTVITVEMNNDQILDAMAEGNTDARKILEQVLHAPFLGGHRALLMLDTMGTRGNAIKTAFDDSGDLPGFLCYMRENYKLFEKGESLRWGAGGCGRGAGR